MENEREQVARRVSKEASELTRLARSVDFEVLAQMLDMVRLEADQHFKSHDPNPGS